MMVQKVIFDIFSEEKVFFSEADYIIENKNFHVSIQSISENGMSVRSGVNNSVYDVKVYILNDETHSSKSSIQFHREKDRMKKRGSLSFRMNPQPKWKSSEK